MNDFWHHGMRSAIPTKKLTKDIYIDDVLRVYKLHVYKVVVMTVVHDVHHAYQPPAQYSYSSNVQSIVAYDAFNATTNDYGADR